VGRWEREKASCDMNGRADGIVYVLASWNGEMDGWMDGWIL
jgi:hypothetical protein